MRVALVEDHLMMRDVLRRVCARDFGCEIVGEWSGVAEALANAARARPDVLLLDLQLPDGDGLHLWMNLRDQGVAARALVLSSRCDPRTVYRVERSGVSGFIDKGSQTVEQLGTALAAVAEGRTYFCPAFVQARNRRLRDGKSFDKILSDREQTVLGCLADCLDDGEIAERLNISPETVAKHRFNLLGKLDLDSTAQLRRYARTQGFGT